MHATEIAVWVSVDIIDYQEFACSVTCVVGVIYLLESGSIML